MRRILILFFMLAGISAALAADKADLRYMLGQKIMLDIRYFCSDGTPAKTCRQPVTTLPKALATLFAEQHIGGVILFSENIQNQQQLTKLTQDLQRTSEELLFIATDQEGGRVARLPTDFLPAFGGAMALGAVSGPQQLSLASEVATHIGKALRQSGININFAPTVDVNSNPDNPVINVRSFGDDPAKVAMLGLVKTQSLLATGILPALKHFPGHGDTHVDSHAGLPVVTHNKTTIMQTDIYPFAQIIAQSDPQLLPMVMTAHIQYPALDNSTLTVKTTSGTKKVIRPATLSKRILTDVLRGELGFRGLIVTDALDMAGIIQFFSADTAVLETWRAGSDIALMPYTIRTPSDITKFISFLDQLEATLTNSDMQHITASFRRIQQTKQMLQQSVEAGSSLIDSDHLTAVSPSGLHRTYDKQAAFHTAYKLARKSITTIKPISLALQQKLREEKLPKILLVMPDELRCQGFIQALNKVRQALQLNCISTAVKQAWSAHALALDSYDAVLWGELSPAQSVVEMGGMEDWAALRQAGQTRATIAEQLALLDRILQEEEVRNKLVLLGLRAPYAVLQRQDKVAGAFALYDYRVTPESFWSPTLEILAEHLLLGKNVYGELPVKYP